MFGGLTRFFGKGGKKRSYDGASRGRMFLKWNPSSSGPNTLAIDNLEQLRKRSRDMARNNPWVTSAIESMVSNLTEPGITPISRALDKNFRTDIRTLWGDWGRQADAAGVLSFDLLVGLAVRSMIESGEVFLRLRPRRIEDGLVVPLQVQIIESDHCPIDTTVTPANPNNKVIAGIEFDPLGRRVAYWMYPEHPGESADYKRDMMMLPTRIDASEILHLYDQTRPGQIRGIPKLASILTRLRELSEYEGAELTKKKIASLFVGAITSPAPDADLLDEDEGMDEQENVNWAKLEPGTVMALEPGEEMKFNDPPAGDSTYEPHVKMQLRATAAAFGVTYEQMTGDLTGVNFSSIRAGLNEFQRRARRLQRLVIHQLCHAVWDRWIDTAVMSGAVVAPDYATRRMDYARVEWRPPGWKYVNPQQEIAATKEEIKGGLRSRQQVAAEQGQDIAEIDAQIAEDKERAKSLGLKFDTDADGTDSDTGTVQVSQDEDSPDTPNDDADPEDQDEDETVDVAKAKNEGGRQRLQDKVRTGVTMLAQQELEATFNSILDDAASGGKDAG